MRELLRLALPIVAAELGWITMGIVDTIMVSALGPSAIGAVGTGSTLFFAVIVLGMGTIFALDTFVSQSYGAGRLDECHRWLVAGLQLAGVLSVMLIGVGWIGIALLPHADLHPAVYAILRPYLSALLWSVAPLMAFTVFRRYLQAMNAVGPIMFALVSANAINVLANWMLVYGHGGAPALGAIGSAYATLAARLYLAAVLFGVILWRERTHPSGLHDVPWSIDRARMWALVRLGAPAAGQIALEVGVFGAVSILAGRITPIALAANQVVLNIVSFFFMVPLGFSSATAVRVGQAVGRQDAAGVRRAGWTGLALAVSFGLLLSGLYVAAASPLLHLFTADPTVLGLGATLLAVSAVFTPFDSVQSVATGALRGLGDTHTAMTVNLVLHWCVGLPLAYVLCFRLGWGVAGLWTGLMTSLILIGSLLTYFWYTRSRVLARRAGFS